MNPHHQTATRERTTGACSLIAAAAAAPAAPVPAIFAEDQRQIAAATARYEKAMGLYVQGKYAEAEAEYRAVLAIFQRALGAKDRKTLSVRNDLALALGAQGRNGEAEAEHRARIAIEERVLGRGGSRHPFEPEKPGPCAPCPRQICRIGRIAAKKK